MVLTGRLELKELKIHTDPGSAPTSSMNTLPNSSKERRQRPNSMSWEITIPMKLHWGLERKGCSVTELNTLTLSSPAENFSIAAHFFSNLIHNSFFYIKKRPSYFLLYLS